MERIPEIMTPGQAADYLQLDRETVYRYIRSGKLLASRLGKSYRIPRRSIDLLLWTTRTAPQALLRDYDPEQVASFLQDDQLDTEAETIAQGFMSETQPSKQGRKGMTHTRRLTP